MALSSGDSKLPSFPDSQAVHKLLAIDEPANWWDESEFKDILNLQLKTAISDDVEQLETADALAAIRILETTPIDQKTYRAALFSTQPNLDLLRIIKAIAKRQLTASEPMVPREISLLLHDLACAQAVRFYGVSITSKSIEDVLAGFAMLVAKPWLPEEIKVALRDAGRAIDQRGAT